jgi:hypothetical protein
MGVTDNNAYRDITIRFPGQIIIGKNALLKLIDEVSLAGYTNVIVVTIEPCCPNLSRVYSSLKNWV